MKRLFLIGASTIGGLIASASAFAQTPITVPTGLGASTTAFVGGQFADSGTLTVAVLVIGIPLAIWLIHAVKGLFPSSRARK